MTPEQRERIRLLTLDGLPASRIAILMGLRSKAIVSCQRGLGLAHVAVGNARRFKVAGLLTASPPKQRATLFAVPVDFSPSPAGDFVRMPCPPDSLPVVLVPSVGHAPSAPLFSPPPGPPPCPRFSD